MDFAAATARMDRALDAHLGAVAVVYATAAGVSYSTTPSGATLVGIFDANHVQVARAEGQADSVGPAVSMLLADLPIDPKADVVAGAGGPTLTISGGTYRLRGFGDRDAGRIVLLLSRVL
jgi:hypothetical protein